MFPFPEEDFRMIAILVVVFEFIGITLKDNVSLGVFSSIRKGSVPVECTGDICPAGIRMVSVLFQPDTVADILAIGILDEFYCSPFPVIWVSSVLLGNQLAILNSEKIRPSGRIRRTPLSMMNRSIV